MVCGGCGLPGHNIRTCSKRSKTPNAACRVRHCGICGQTGHDRRKCPFAIPPAVRHCSECGSEAHDRRTCPLIHGFENLSIRPLKQDRQLLQPPVPRRAAVIPRYDYTPSHTPQYPASNTLLHFSPDEGQARSTAIQAPVVFILQEESRQPPFHAGNAVPSRLVSAKPDAPSSLLMTRSNASQSTYPGVGVLPEAKSLPNASSATQNPYEENNASISKDASDPLHIHSEKLIVDKKKKSNLLGRGSFGQVWKGKWGEIPVAVKEVPSSHLSQDAISDFEKEAYLHYQLKHPNIVRLLGTSKLENEGSLVLVLELMSKTLRDLLKQKDIQLSWLLRASLARDMTTGLQFLHAKKIIHRDLKSMNVLLDNSNCAKLTDFGLAKVKSDIGTSTMKPDTVGTIAWMAPELFKRKAKQTTECDVYSLGVIIWELCSRKLPFEGEDSRMISTWVQSGDRPDLPDDKDVPPIFLEIIGTKDVNCWATDPSKRCSLEFILTKLRHFLST